MAKYILPANCEINALAECFGGEFNYTTLPEKKKVTRIKKVEEVILAVPPIRRKR